MSDEKEKKSWRERDAAKDKSRHRDERPKKGGKERSAGDDYKRDLEKLFSGGTDVPDRFKNVAEKLKPEEGSPEHAWNLAVDTLRNTEGFRDFVKAVTEFRKAGHAFPDDEEVMIRVLDHPSESILVAAVTHLIEQTSRKKLKRTTLIKNRLTTIRLACEDPKTHALIDELSKSL